MLLIGLNQSSFNPTIKGVIKNQMYSLVTAKPTELIGLEQDLLQFILKYQGNASSTRKQLNLVFNYKSFIGRRPNSVWNSYKLAEALNINTCVYCNRQYTFTVSINEQKITRPQFDHYFPRSKHPALGLSFYNLIPCCSICNLLKHDTEFQVGKSIHPYVNEFGDEGVFTHLPRDYQSMVGRAKNMDVKILTKNHGHLKEAILFHKKQFHLEGIYQEHADVIQEILWKGQFAKGSYLKWLRGKFGASLTEEEVYRFGIGNYSELGQLDKRVLAKLTRDVAVELELIKNRKTLEARDQYNSAFDI